MRCRMDCGTSQSGRWKIKVLANDPIGSYSHLCAQLALQLHCSPSEARLLQASDGLENKILIRCSFTDKTKHVTVFRFKKKSSNFDQRIQIHFHFMIPDQVQGANGSKCLLSPAVSFRKVSTPLKHVCVFPLTLLQKNK